MKSKNTMFLVQAATIGAIYVVLTLLFAPLSYGEVQVRFSEALTILPYFTPAAIPGLFVGCILSNLLGGAIPVDIIFGSIATLIGAVFTYKLRGSSKWLAPLPPIVANTVIVPFVLYYGYGEPSNPAYDVDRRCRRSHLLRNLRNDRPHRTFQGERFCFWESKLF